MWWPDFPHEVLFVMFWLVEHFWNLLGHQQPRNFFLPMMQTYSPSMQAHSPMMQTSSPRKQINSPRMLIDSPRMQISLPRMQSSSPMCVIFSMMEPDWSVSTQLRNTTFLLTGCHATMDPGQLYHINSFACYFACMLKLVKKKKERTNAHFTCNYTGGSW